MEAMTVREAVQETLIRQFLIGADPSSRLSGGPSGQEEPEEGRPKRVEDLAWWRYDRSLAMWYCEWLDAYYDSGDRAFLRRDELTQRFEPADLAELRERSARMRLELPEHDGPAPEGGPEGECGEAAGGAALEGAELEEEARGAGGAPAAEEEGVEASEGGTAALFDPDTARAAAGAVDGGWHDTAAGVDCEEEPDWAPDGHGNLTHWSAATGRLFLWQEEAGVLYEHLRADRAGAAAGAGERYCALWAAQGPLCALSRVDEPQVSRLVDSRGAELGKRPRDEDAGWALRGPALLPSHARVFPNSDGHWWVEALSPNAETLVDGEHVGASRAARLHHGAVLRLGGGLELRVDLPDWPGAPPCETCAAGGKATSSATSRGVLERGFKAKEEEEEVGERRPPPPPLAGAAERARALNAALRRVLCRATPRERAEAREREARYEDQAAKRRRLRPEPSAAEALLLRHAAALAAAFSEAALPEAAERYQQDVAGTMDSAGCFTGDSIGNAGLGFRPPATGAQRLARARRSKGGVRFLPAEGEE